MSLSESSNDRKGLSCAECRRSKLKCDRVFPCQSCIRRGCAHICPDGAMPATKGNKVLAAHARRLTEQVKSMSVRIKDLEKALSNAQAWSGREPHPLLHHTLTQESDPLDETEAQSSSPTAEDVSDAIGSLSIGREGQARYRGETAGSEYLQDLLPVKESATRRKARDPKYLGVPFELLELANAFPFGMRESPYTKQHFLSFLPSKERALALADLYYTNAAWMYDPVVRGEFMHSIIEPVYGTSGIPSLDPLHSHRLSVYFMILATGTLFDDHPSSDILAEQYHVLACAALSLDSILVEASCSAVQTLFMMFHFIYLSDRTSNESRWLLTGLCDRVAQVIGLQRDSAGWNLDPAEIQRRRIMFWELFTWDAWTSVVNGRPPALNIHYTDARFPDDLDPSFKSSNEIELGFHAWKFRYSATCLSISVQHAFSTKVPAYSTLLELDRKIRTFPVPAHLQSPMQWSEAGRAWSYDPPRAMQQYCIVCERESNLLYIHRSYFAQAIRSNSTNPLGHKYATSVLATYRSALRLISSLQGLYPIHPALTSRVWFFWSGIFSACIVLGALIVESPGCELAPNALQEFDQAYAFYEDGSRPCRPPATMTMLEKLRERAHQAYSALRFGGVAVSPGLKSRQHGTSDALDELEVLGGRKSVISLPTRSPAHAGSSQPEAQVQLNPAVHTTDMRGIHFPNQFGDTHPSMAEFYEGYGALGSEGTGAGVHHEYFSTSEQISGRTGDIQHSAISSQGLASYAANLGPASSHNTGDSVQSAQFKYPSPPYSHESVPARMQYRDNVPIQKTSSTLERNQDEIWRNFVQHLDL